MKSFYTIAQKHCGAKRVFFPDNDTSDSCIQFWKNIYAHEINSSHEYNRIKSIFYQLINVMHTKMQKKYYKRRSAKTKFVALEQILNNMFLSDLLREEILIMFSKIQRTYHGFSRLALLYKFKKTTIRYSTDLCLNPIDSTKHNVISIYQNGAVYLFVIQELINIIEHALSNCVNFFCQPLPIKNPYNNMKFSIAILHHIYFFIKSQPCAMPHLFNLYFADNFDLTQFSYNNESMIRDISIKNHVFTSPAASLELAIMTMLRQNSYAKRLNISELFPIEKLANIMRPYLYLFYISRYSLNHDKKYYCLNKLNLKLMQFYKFNKLFGRLVRKGHATAYTFNDSHVNFYSKIKNSTNEWTVIDKTLLSPNQTDVEIEAAMGNESNSDSDGESDGEYESSEDDTISFDDNYDA